MLRGVLFEMAEHFAQLGKRTRAVRESWMAMKSRTSVEQFGILEVLMILESAAATSPSSWVSDFSVGVSLP